MSASRVRRLESAPRMAPRRAPARRERGRRWVALAALCVALAPALAAALPAPPAAQTLESAPVRNVEGTTCIGANDLARLLDATKYWHPEVRKLELRAHGHRVQLTADNPFVLVDDATLRLDDPVRSVDGEFQVPVQLIDSLPSDSSESRLLYDPRRSSVLVLPPGGVVGTPRVTSGEGVTRIVFPVERPEDAAVVARARAHFRVRFTGFFTGTVPDSALPAPLRGLVVLPSLTGCAFELRLGPEAGGFRIERDARARRVTLSFARTGGAGWEAFAPEGPPGPRRIRVVVIDPGHGGGDTGVSAGGLLEKDLTLVLARELRRELQRRLAARVMLTRDDDRALSVDARAEFANRSRADLVLSLHFDGFPGVLARGASAYCPPAVVGGSSESRADAASAAAPLLVLPWREVASRHAVESRALAEAVLSSLELRGEGPTRLREVLPMSLLGVNAPGMLLECATLTSEVDRARLAQSDGMAALASAIADGIEAWQRNE